jgi:hypothetical protein
MMLGWINRIKTHVKDLRMMRNLLFITLLFFMNISSGQCQTMVSIIDFVKVKNDKHQEALYYYENNWKVFRDIALAKGYIKSYRLLSTKADSMSNFDLILMTEYADSTQYKLSEERFQKIIKEASPNGLKLLNELKPNDFRQNVFFKKTETLFTSDKKRNAEKNKR